MTLNESRCRLCEGEMTLQPLERIEGEEHGVRLRIERMPAMSCAQGHRRFVVPTFASVLLDALLADPPLVPLEGAGRRGLLFKRNTCPGCDAVLEGAASGRIESHHVIELDGLAPFDVHVEMATFRCSACSRESVEPKDAVLEDLMKASAHAFRSGELAAS